ncbi:phosphatidylinositol transfer protein csr1 [Gnomoniopsis smithogilvyi]|uniref:Phosphatidylinositol transfer protein csr1 n=1 Tax=Gnomoniopsis smithogilvyi TaxID=1191159 RepID=A0A9W8YM68_9PEZI|nr:phosphatidylinositol transfer protein csr1 [Gnomoniopsis smithogilvyi]
MSGIQHEELPGRVGNLTPDQEQKLRELWAAIFKVCAVGDPEGAEDDAASTTGTEPLADKSTNAKEKPKKRRITMFSRKGHKDKNGDSDAASTASGVSSSVKADDADDKYGQNKQFLETLANTSPEIIRATIWSMVKHDHPDALVLRFLRARKWDVNKALVMLVSTMNWRATEMHVDDEIMKNGEAAMVELTNSDDPKKKQLGEDFMAQIRMGKSFLHGLDNKGRPICVVRVRCHHQGEQCEESLERYTVYLIETARMVLRPPVDTATVLFDMTGFSMANMDYTPLKFMIKCFEANYPESLGSVLVHKSPWLFQGIWKVIRGWLDPVVASKVHFTNNIKDLEDFISASRVPKELDGDEDFEYKYVEPVPGENDKMNDTTTRDGLLAAREQLYQDYEEATAQWIRNPEDAAIKAQRDSIAAKLRVDYWQLDEYVRARALVDRTGWIQGEKVEPYPTKKEAAVQTSENGVGTSSDDVD